MVLMSFFLSCEPASILLERLEIESRQNRFYMNEGEEQSLVARVWPEDADDPSLYWTSSDSTVASVTDEGLVRALSAGTTQIGLHSRTVPMSTQLTLVGNLDTGRPS